MSSGHTRNVPELLELPDMGGLPEKLQQLLRYAAKHNPYDTDRSGKFVDILSTLYTEKGDSSVLLDNVKAAMEEKIKGKLSDAVQDRLNAFLEEGTRTKRIQFYIGEDNLGSFRKAAGIDGETPAPHAATTTAQLQKNLSPVKEQEVFMRLTKPVGYDPSKSNIVQDAVDSFNQSMQTIFKTVAEAANLKLKSDKVKIFIVGLKIPEDRKPADDGKLYGSQIIIGPDKITQVLNLDKTPVQKKAATTQAAPVVAEPKPDKPTLGRQRRGAGEKLPTYQPPISGSTPAWNKDTIFNAKKSKLEKVKEEQKQTSTPTPTKGR